MNDKKQIKAVGLLSGGLGSILAIRVMIEQGSEATALHFRAGFSYFERNRLAEREPAKELFDAERAASILRVSLKIIDVPDEYIPVVLHPRYGYGSEMNPCVDCRIFLLRQAKVWMEAHAGCPSSGYHFIFTGEVVGQRPKSQMRPTACGVTCSGRSRPGGSSRPCRKNGVG